MATGEFTSGFGMRYHPILHYTRPHNGVDWAAPIGTPIFAAGNGVVEKAGWDAGYGRRVEIAHANGYVTTYNHMSRFGRGIIERRPCPAGPDRRLSRRERPRDGSASSLRGHRQRPLCRSDEGETGAHPATRQPKPPAVRARTGPDQQSDGQGPDRGARRRAVDIRRGEQRAEKWMPVFAKTLRKQRTLEPFAIRPKRNRLQPPFASLDRAAPRGGPSPNGRGVSAGARAGASSGRPRRERLAPTSR